MKHHARTDANHAAIVDALRRVGAAVTSLAAVGHGVPDLLVSYRGQWILMELKDGAQPPSRRRLTPDEAAWCQQQHAPVWVVGSVDDALMALGAGL